MTIGPHRSCASGNMEVVGDHAARLRKAPVDVASAVLTAIADGSAAVN